jgi:hypothetical protein
MTGTDQGGRMGLRFSGGIGPFRASVPIRAPRGYRRTPAQRERDWRARQEFRTSPATAFVLWAFLLFFLWFLPWPWRWITVGLTVLYGLALFVFIGIRIEEHKESGEWDAAGGGARHEEPPERSS